MYSGIREDPSFEYTLQTYNICKQVDHLYKTCKIALEIKEYT